MKRVVLGSGKEKPVVQRHPWVFSGAIRSVEEGVSDGDLVDVQDANGTFLARGYINRRSQITVRLLSWIDEAIDEAWLRARLERAIQGRRLLRDPGPDGAERLVNAESDGLPGLVVDRYGPYLAVQLLTLGIERLREPIVRLLQEMLRPAGVYARNDVDVRRHEGLAVETELLAGGLPPDRVVVDEDGRRFAVDIRAGQKTGFYLDQRENRARSARYFRGLGSVLNCFAYTGGFGVYAAGADAGTVVSVDSSGEALELARENMALNGLGDRADEWIVGDVFQVLRQFRGSGRTFDAIVLDPPKFANTQGQVQAACRGYKDINWLAFRLLNPGGALVTFSCSGLVGTDLFQKVVFGAAIDAERDAQVVERLSQSPDHPILLTFPESEYLKGLVCRVW